MLQGSQRYHRDNDYVVMSSAWKNKFCLPLEDVSCRGSLVATLIALSRSRPDKSAGRANRRGWSDEATDTLVIFQSSHDSREILGIPGDPAPPPLAIISPLISLSSRIALTREPVLQPAHIDFHETSARHASRGNISHVFVLIRQHPKGWDTFQTWGLIVLIRGK